jgi:hypothetical protein
MARGGTCLGQKSLCNLKTFWERPFQIVSLKVIDDLVACPERFLSTGRVVWQLIGHTQDRLHVVEQVPGCLVGHGDLH